MRIAKQLIHFILLSCTTLSFGLSTVYAAKDRYAVDITDTMISSYHSCPKKSVSSLSCATYYQTTNYTCGPAAVMTLMRYYGKLSASDMNRNTELRIANEMGAVPGENGGTTPSDVASWLDSHGLSVDSGSNVTTDMIIDNIKKGIPTLVTYNNHWVLAKGYNKASDPSQDEIIFSDSCCGVSTISRDTLDSTWQESHMQRRHCSSTNGDYIAPTAGR